MNIYLTFDVEIWCRSWSTLDQDFPSSYERYVYGRHGGNHYALPKTLEMLNKYDLRGVFFVEPLFSARFGREYLNNIVGLIKDAGQEVQFHLHPEWTDEITPPPLANIRGKRQHLSYYSLDEQTQLIAFALGLLGDCGVDRVSAFRAGSFAANRDTLLALRANGIAVDSSFDATVPISGSDLRNEHSFSTPFQCKGVICYPLATFVDGFGRLRHAQVGACSFAEMRDAIRSAYELGWNDFVVLSHNFEMLRVGKSDPDYFVVRRFESLCRFLSTHRDRFSTCGWAKVPALAPGAGSPAVPKTSLLPTGIRLIEQVARRIL